ncbi:phosphoribosyltransferase [Candidatus Nitrosotenuis sp. DW1]|uniref:phosphoribosyltransferase n=1 Tax=Candidatus Nitrosotenuis sp. DW1 TaxID=2259672 RepID=UPI0015CE290C|nr:phosphoribosyltransferase [Candidatus Nitrosotenuis sp. DW1]QLH08264.1 phosphoribosyltransferase [Candidatus Nitrosotenuis sp. DW1]
MEKKTYDSKSWENIEACTATLVKKILDKGISFNSISTVSRGGLVPARLVADRLGIKQILVDEETISVDSLFVDDIYDTGETFRRVIEKADNQGSLVYATLFARRKEHYPKQLVYAELTNGDEYIVYPWDRFEHDASLKSQI